MVSQADIDEMVESAINPPPPSPKFFIGIDNLYERPNRSGYTVSPLEAGIYDEKTAKAVHGVEDADGHKRWAKHVSEELVAWGITEQKLLDARDRIDTLLKYV